MKKIPIIYIIIGALAIFSIFNFIQTFRQSSFIAGSLPTVSSGDTITSAGWNNMIEKINNTEATTTKVGSIYNTATTSDYLLVADGRWWNSTSSMIIDNTGYVGIGTTTPSSKTEIWGGEIRVINNSTTSCSAAIAGSIFFNGTDRLFWKCNGTSWSTF